MTFLWGITSTGLGGTSKVAVNPGLGSTSTVAANPGLGSPSTVTANPADGERPRQDSNLRTWLRRPVLSPLSYEGEG